MDRLRFAVDKVVHHDDIELVGILATGSVSGRDPDPRDACVIKDDPEECLIPIAG